MTISLLLIDPQIDFCHPQGALFVPGADQDMRRLAGMIDRTREKIDAIHVTLDSHHFVHIANPIFWTDAAGNAPEPFTRISITAVENGDWRARNPAWVEYAIEYVRRLEKNGRYQLTIWPPHCLIGSRGQAVEPLLFDALLAWESQSKVVNYIQKGSNLLTEHYSAVKADVPAADDPHTQLNTDLIRALSEADQVAIAGEARTHCIANTVRDIVDSFEDPARIANLILLTDAMSDIPGFETFSQDFMREMTARGVRLQTTNSFLA